MSVPQIAAVSAIFLVFTFSGHIIYAQTSDPCPNPGTFGCFEVGLPGKPELAAGQTIDTFVSSGTPILTFINTAVNVVVAILVIIGVISIVVGGYVYMTAAGNANQVGTAKEIIKAALFGIVIALTSVIILNTINTFLGSGAKEPELGSGTGGGAGEAGGNSPTSPNTTNGNNAPGGELPNSNPASNASPDPELEPEVESSTPPEEPPSNPLTENEINEITSSNTVVPLDRVNVSSRQALATYIESTAALADLADKKQDLELAIRLRDLDALDRDQLIKLNTDIRNFNTQHQELTGKFVSSRNALLKIREYGNTQYPGQYNYNSFYDLPLQLAPSQLVTDFQKGVQYAGVNGDIGDLVLLP